MPCTRGKVFPLSQRVRAHEGSERIVRAHAGNDLAHCLLMGEVPDLSEKCKKVKS